MYFSENNSSNLTEGNRMAQESEHECEQTFMLFIFSVQEFAKSHNLNVHRYDWTRAEVWWAMFS